MLRSPGALELLAIQGHYQSPLARTFSRARCVGLSVVPVITVVDTLGVNPLEPHSLTLSPLASEHLALVLLYYGRGYIPLSIH